MVYQFKKTNDREKGKKSSLKTQLTLSIMVIVLMMLLVGAVSYLVSNNTRSNLDDLSKRSIPISNTVTNVSNLTTKLISSGHELVKADSASVAETHYGKIQEYLYEEAAYFDDIRKNAGSDVSYVKIAEKLQEHHNLVSKYASDLISMKMQVLGVERELDLNLQVAKKLHEEFIVNIVPVVDDVVFTSMLYLKTHTDKDEHISHQEELSDQINVIVDTLELESEGETLFGLLETIIHVTNADNIVPLKERYTATWERFAEQYDKLINGADQQAAVAMLIDINKINDVAKRILSVKTSHLEIKENLDDVISNMEIASRGLAKNVDTLVTLSNNDINDSTNGIIAALGLGQVITAAIGIFCILFSVFIAWFYIHKKLILRMSALRDCMTKISSGESVDIFKLKYFDEIDEMAKAVGVFKDNMQENVQLNKALEKNVSDLNKARDVVENIVDGIITIDEKGIITGFSQAATEIFGYQENEVVGGNISMLMPQPYATEHDGYHAKLPAEQVLEKSYW